MGRLFFGFWYSELRKKSRLRARILQCRLRLCQVRARGARRVGRTTVLIVFCRRRRSPVYNAFRRRGGGRQARSAADGTGPPRKRGTAPSIPTVLPGSKSVLFTTITAVIFLRLSAASTLRSEARDPAKRKPGAPRRRRPPRFGVSRSSLCHGERVDRMREAASEPHRGR